MSKNNSISIDQLCSVKQIVDAQLEDGFLNELVNADRLVVFLDGLVVAVVGDADDVGHEFIGYFLLIS